MDYTWGLPVGSGMPTAWPYYQYPQQVPGYNPYLMSQPWMSGSMPMYPYGGYFEGVGQMQQNQEQQIDVKPIHKDLNYHEDVSTSPSAKKRRLNEPSSDPISFVDIGLLDQEVHPDSTIPSLSLDGLDDSKCPTPTSPTPVVEEHEDSNDSTQFTSVLDSSAQNVGYNNTDNTQDSFYSTQNQSFSHNAFNESHIYQSQSFNQSHSSESFYQHQQRADSPIESDSNLNLKGSQPQESLMVILPDGSKTALMDLQLPTAPFSNYQPPQEGTFVFSAPVMPLTGKAPRSRRTSGSASTGSGNNYCHLCNKTYESKYKLKLHMHAHTGERPYVCNICGKGFSRGPNLNAHMRVHTGAKPFSCTRCLRGFSHPSDRIIHMVTEVCLRADRILRKVTDGFECTVCDSGVMEDKEHAERHARQHEAGKGLFCPVCRISFQGQKAHVLVKHVRENHPEYLVAFGG